MTEGQTNLPIKWFVSQFFKEEVQMLGFLKLLIILGSLAVIFFLAFKKKTEVGRNEFPFALRIPGLIGGIVIFILAIFLVSAIGAIPAGYRGVVLQFGAVTDKTLDEGIYVINPITQSVEFMSVQVLAYEADAASASRDLQDVSTKVTLNYFLDPKTVNRTYQTLRHDYEVRIIKPAIQEGVKASTAQFDVEQLVKERATVKEKIETYLKERLGAHGILVDAISITDFHFSPDFAKAIEDKQTAVQKALEAKNKLEEIKMVAQQKIEMAKAEATSLSLQKQQITPDLVKFRQIEVEFKRLDVQLKALEKWNGVLPTTVTGSGPVPILDIFGK